MGNEKINSEKLAYWYFRLNGFLTITNVIVHPDYGRGQRTDVDILGVRFPYRAELLENLMIDDEVFTKIENKTYIIIAEVKSQTCNLNRYWRDPERKDMHRIISFVGAFGNDAIDKVAAELYKEGIYMNDYYHISLFCVGKQIQEELRRSHPNIPQITWKDILRFIYNRFEKYKPQKSAHTQWDCTGQQLWSIFLGSKDENEFVEKIKELIL